MSETKEQLWGREFGDSPERTKAIIDAIGGLPLPRKFYVIDIACGTAELIGAVADHFPFCRTFGIDIEPHESWQSRRYRQEVLLHIVSVQAFIADPTKRDFDVVTMLNSYRNWVGTAQEKADFDAWLGRNARYFITSDAGNNNLPWPKRVIGKDAKDYDLVLYTIRGEA